ncbi:chitin deacetylase, carbohydrate esterase family 4 protein [Rhodotorula toruloides]|uniref:chitin deacetylase n=1 Tax=Rhodotorula toruloides TaxID=5286 RepID=A0A511KPY5_RHOTO|nr:chitin deacetylase, carbohydrate esterase family 4 protein [Rhodotorula toruloides]
MRLWLAALGLLTSTLASPLYSRQTSTLPAPGIRGPTPKSEWVARYEAAKAAGQIPTFAPAKMSSTGIAGCFGDDNISDAPDGTYGVSFDEGPLPSSLALYQFLLKQNQTATHFFIGTNIVNNPDMTTLNDTQILGELGWTAQAIHDFSGGLVPKFWRPPYGDVDDRVRAIAREVFNLTLVGWNRDSNDWCLNSGPGACPSYGPQSQADLESKLRGWMVGRKSPGSCGLEHESGDKTVGAFINTYPGIKQHGWDARCIPDLFNLSWYLNSPRNAPAH